MRNFLENDIKHLEREIKDCNTRYSQLISKREQLMRNVFEDPKKQADVQ